MIFTCQEISDEILELKPDYIDLPHTASNEQFLAIPPSIKRICSFHDFEKTPEDLEGVYEKLQKKPADFYKVATFANSTCDALRMLLLMKKHPVIGVAMGERGKVARILAPTVSKLWTYAPLFESHRTAEGQLLIEELKGIYHAHLLSRKTQLYGLIGDPIEASISYRTHNFLFEQYGIDAVYVKMRVTKEELPTFLPLAEELGFQGLSVTMPLKAAIVPHLDEVHSDVGAINTVKITKKWEGWNTDGIGSVDAIEKRAPIKGSRFAILGGGGTAKSIAREAAKRGAEVTLFNRTPSKLCRPLDEFSKASYDVLVNATPVEKLIDFELLCSRAVVLDAIVSSKKTPLLVAAEKKGCAIIEGAEMFIQQAALQFNHWFS